MTTRFRRPAMLTAEQAESIVGGVDPARRSEAAHMTARAIVSGGRAEANDPELLKRLITLVDSEGVDVVASLWADSPATTLPGIMWRLYLLREWAKQAGTEVANHFRLGSRHAEVDGVVAGVAYRPGPKEILDAADAVLSGVFRGDFAVTLERAGAYCRVLATGAALDADSAAEDRAAILTSHGALLQNRAEEFEKAAAMWRAGRLD